ncbi:MAG: PQQ-binding-like beta-propeller repeat protein [Verrucomicrobiales bacterium]|nr:PQQ-binding-like beta-propeller repeat protein [Verrucomicrobiales bacterium]
MKTTLLRWLAVGMAGTTGILLAQEWPRFRGPNGSGLGQAAALPAQWAPSDFAWKARLPGTGHSSPVLWGERLVVTAADPATGHFSVLGFHADTGARLWQRDYPVPHHGLHRNNTFASASAAADGSQVYVPRVQDDRLWLTALTLDGAPVWEVDLGGFNTEHGLGHSPIEHDGRVFLAQDHDDLGRIVALEAATGRLVWEVPRSAGYADYSVPCVLASSATSQVLVFNSQEDGISGVDARTGTVVWRSDRVLRMRSVSSPIAAGNLVFGTCGSGGGGHYLVALRPPNRDQARPSVAYEIRKAAPYVPSPLALGDHLFLWSDGGIVTCARLATGTSLWQERVGGNFFSSPVAADGKLINVSTTGEVVAVAAAESFVLLGRTPLGEASHATPAIARGRLYVRTLSQVVCLGPEKGSGTGPPRED